MDYKISEEYRDRIIEILDMMEQAVVNVTAQLINNGMMPECAELGNAASRIFGARGVLENLEEI